MHIHHLGFGGPQELTQGDNSIDVKSLNDMVCRKDFEIIVKDKNLFLAKFCKTFAEKRDKPNEGFDVEVVGDQVSITGRKHIISKVKEQVELFRSLALEAFETRCEVDRVIISIIDDYFLRKPSSTNCIDLTDWLSDNVKDKMDKMWFRDFVRPYLHDFFESLAFNYSDSKTTQLVQNDELFAPKHEKVIAIRIALKHDQHLTYPITPVAIPSVSCPDPSFYERYKLGKLCDYSLISSEGKELRVHGIILDIYGGPYFQTLLSSKMKETIEKSIKMDYPYEVIQNVVDTLYLGPKHLEGKLFGGEEIDVYGILQFAHAHNLQPLFKQMINLLMLIARSSDAETIKGLANCYRDDDLHRLANHLSSVTVQLKV